MSRWNNIRTWTTRNFIVSLDWQYESDPDLSWADAETLEMLDNGSYINATFRVVVYWQGRKVGADYLGNSVYADPEEFAKEHFGLAAKSRADGVTYGCYLPGMLASAIAAARQELRRMADEMPKVRAA